MAVSAWDDYKIKQRLFWLAMLGFVPVVLAVSVPLMLLELSWAEWVVFPVGFAWMMFSLIALANYGGYVCPRCKGPLFNRQSERLFRRGCGQCGLPITQEAFEAASQVVR